MSALIFNASLVTPPGNLIYRSSFYIIAKHDIMPQQYTCRTELNSQGHLLLIDPKTITKIQYLTHIQGNLQNNWMASIVVI